MSLLAARVGLLRKSRTNIGIASKCGAWAAWLAGQIEARIIGGRELHSNEITLKQGTPEALWLQLLTYFAILFCGDHV